MIITSLLNNNIDFYLLVFIQYVNFICLMWIHCIPMLVCSQCTIKKNTMSIDLAARRHFHGYTCKSSICIYLYTVWSCALTRNLTSTLVDYTHKVSQAAGSMDTLTTCTRALGPLGHFTRVQNVHRDVVL